jgi:hypothetical protein
MKPCSFTKVPYGPHTYFPNILWVQKEGTQICVSEWSQGLTHAQDVDCFLLSTTLPTNGVIAQPHYIQMSSQGVMSSKNINNSPGFCPLEDNKWALVARLRPKIVYWHTWNDVTASCDNPSTYGPSTLCSRTFRDCLFVLGSSKSCT